MPNDSSTKEEIAKIVNDFQKEIEDGKINTYQETDIVYLSDDELMFQYFSAKQLI